MTETAQNVFNEVDQLGSLLAMIAAESKQYLPLPRQFYAEAEMLYAKALDTIAQGDYQNSVAIEFRAPDISMLCELAKSALRKARRASLEKGDYAVTMAECDRMLAGMGQSD